MNKNYNRFDIFFSLFLPTILTWMAIFQIHSWGSKDPLEWLSHLYFIVCALVALMNMVLAIKEIILGAFKEVGFEVTKKVE